MPFAVTEEELLAELGWNLWDNGRDIKSFFFRERGAQASCEIQQRRMAVLL